MNIVDDLWEKGHIRPVDRHFARFLAERFGDDESFVLLAALVSAVTGEGHTCLDLDALADLPFYREYSAALDRLATTLPASAALGAPGEYLPLIRQGNRCYLHRYFHYESTIVDHLATRMALRDAAPAPEEVREAIKKFGSFPDRGGELDWQRMAAIIAVLKNFTVISGGPGTGKTTTVARVLAVLIGMGLAAPEKIALAAPTGKAAVRLQEAIRKARGELGCPEIPEQTSTIHRLLGVLPGRTGFRHDRENQLAIDLLLVDEVSMVDVALMARLLDALPQRAKLVLLGDRDQLASVNPGSVFGDLCGAGDIGVFSRQMAALLEQASGFPVAADDGAPSINDHIVGLRTSYRYGAASGMGSLARRINGEEVGDALAVGGEEVAFFPLAETAEQLGSLVRHHYFPCLGKERMEDIFAAFESFRIFSPVRRGPYGIYAINAHVEAMLAAEGLVDLSSGPFYHGRPVIISCNDYSLHLFNGDTGLILHDPEQDRLMAFFLAPDGVLRKFPPSRLPEHETAFALTVHKAQGSEYDHVAFVLPPGDVPVVTRELVYTAVTRARKSVTLFVEEQSFRNGIARQTKRMSGLRERLGRIGGAALSDRAAAGKS